MKSILLTFVIAGLCFFGISHVQECQDLLNYKTHPGLNKITISTLTYFLIYKGININFLTYLSYGIYAFSFFYYFRFQSVRPVSQFLLYNLPWLFSPIFVHYWLCALKGGLAIAFLTPIILLLMSPNFRLRRHFIVILAILAVLAHWSSFLFLFLILLDQLELSSSLIKALTIYKVKKTYLLILPLLLGFIYLVSIFTFKGLSTYIDIDSLLLRKDYGRLFPYVAIWFSFIYLFSVFYIERNTSCLPTGESGSKIPPKVILTASLIFFSIFSLYFSSNAVRFAMPIYFLVFIDFIFRLDDLRISKIVKLSFLSFQSVPFILYFYSNL